MHAVRLIDGIERSLEMPERNAVATRYARDFLDKDRILARFVAEV